MSQLNPKTEQFSDHDDFIADMLNDLKEQDRAVHRDRVMDWGAQTRADRRVYSDRAGLRQNKAEDEHHEQKHQTYIKWLREKHPTGKVKAPEPKLVAPPSVAEVQSEAKGDENVATNEVRADGGQVLPTIKVPQQQEQDNGMQTGVEIEKSPVQQTVGDRAVEENSPTNPESVVQMDTAEEEAKPVAIQEQAVALESGEQANQSVAAQPEVIAPQPQVQGDKEVASEGNIESMNFTPESLGLRSGGGEVKRPNLFSMFKKLIPKGNADANQFRAAQTLAEKRSDMVEGNEDLDKAA
jgi:hypothetical protein